MYSNQLAAAIKSNGKILREFKDTVMIPFGSEYSIYIKNLNSVRALVNVTIDGQDAAPGGLVVYGNQSLDLERFIKNGNLTEGNRFKFIERTDNIEKHRGIGLEDGLIRIAYKFEQPQFTNTWLKTTKYDYFDEPVYKSKGALRGGYPMVGSATPSYSTGATVSTQSFNDAGITVPGSKSEQRFQTASWFATEVTEYVMVIKLLGETLDNKLVLEPVTVKHKPKCTSCGKQNRAHAKYCVECGTALEIFA